MTFPPHLDYLKNPNIVWFDPCWGYYGFWKRLTQFRQERSLDFQSAWLDKDMKRNKELYATALLALSMQQDAPTKHGWWFTKLPHHDPPDGIIGTILEGQIRNIINVREVEIVEYFGGPLLDTLKNKMKNKSYEPNTALVCLLSPNTTKLLNLQNLSQQIQGIKFPLTYIFAVFHGFEIASLPERPGLEDLVKTTLVQLAPEYVVVNFSPHATCKSWLAGKEQSWLKFIGRGKNTDLQKVTVDTTPKLFD